MTLTVADIERWNAGDVREVFHAATSRAQAALDAANGLANLPAFTSWGGESAAAAKEAIGQTRKDLDAHGNEALAVANAARSAADNIEKIKSELASLKADAESLGMEIDPVSGTVLPGPKIRDPMEAELKQAQLQPRLNTIVTEANLVDMALANAINMAGGKTPIPSSAAGTAPPAQPADVDGALDQIAGAPVPANAPKPVVFSAKEIEDFKASARPILQAEGMAPHQGSVRDSVMRGAARRRASRISWDRVDLGLPGSWSRGEAWPKGFPAPRQIRWERSSAKSNTRWTHPVRPTTQARKPSTFPPPQLQRRGVRRVRSCVQVCRPN